MSRNCKAAVFRGPGFPFDLRSVEIPPLEPGEILVRVDCCTICGSDLHTATGRRASPPSCILGHEIIGRIEDWGGSEAPRCYSGRPLERRARIAWAMAVGCGACFYCEAGLPQKCVSVFKYGHVSLDAGGDGRGPGGGLSEFCVLRRGTPVFRIPAELPDATACPANCATATVAAAIRSAEALRRVEGETVLVTGAGMLGLTACAMLAERGAKRIVAADPDFSRLKLAEEFGATDAISVAGEKGTEGTRARLADMTEGRGADLVLDFSGDPSAAASGLASLRIGGTAIWVGAVFSAAALALEAELVVRRMLTIRGVHNYAPEDLAEALWFLAETHRRYPFERLVGERFPLAETDQAFEHALTTKPPRVAVVPGL